MFCTTCGSENDNDAVFCSNCGSNILNPTQLNPNVRDDLMLTESNVNADSIAVCSVCQTENKGSSFYCKQCGSCLVKSIDEPDNISDNLLEETNKNTESTFNQPEYNNDQLDLDTSQGKDKDIEKPKTKFKSNKKLILAFGLVLVLFAGVFGVFTYFSKDSFNNNGISKDITFQSHNFETSISADDAGYITQVTGQTSISKFKDYQMTDFLNLPDGFVPGKMLNLNELIYIDASTVQRSESYSQAIFSVNPDGSELKQVARMDITMDRNKIGDYQTNRYSNFCYLNNAFYAEHYNKANSSNQETIAKITLEGEVSDFYQTDLNTFILDLEANDNNLFYLTTVENQEYELVCLELNDNAAEVVSRINIGKLYAPEIVECSNEFIIISYEKSETTDISTDDASEIYLKIDLSNNSQSEILTLNNYEATFMDIQSSYIYYAEIDDQDSISTYPVQINQFNIETMETKSILNFEINKNEYEINYPVHNVSIDSTCFFGDQFVYRIHISGDDSGNDTYLWFWSNLNGDANRLINRIDDRV